MNEPQLPSPIPATRWLNRISLVWIVPLIAALIGLGLGIRAVVERGPLVTLQFSTAEGLEAGKTHIKFKSVDVGVVQSITLAGDRGSVLVSARMAPEAASLLVDDTRFWVVRPRISASGASGLATVFSGAYIAMDAGKAEGSSRRDFVGLEVPPAVTSDLPGRQFRLHADTLGSLDIGSPLYYRRIEVGHVVGFHMDDDGRGVSIEVFVDAPYDRFVKSDSRFFQASGIDLSIDTSGMRLDTESLTSILLGGIAFVTPDEAIDDQPAATDATFTLHANHDEAMLQPDQSSEKFMLVFDESVRGLKVGAPVDFLGIELGEVSKIQVDYRRHGRPFAMAVEVNLHSERLLTHSRNPGDFERVSPQARQLVLDRLIAQGLRAQLRNGNLLTGQRYIALDFFPTAAPTRIDWKKKEIELPTRPGSLESLQESLASIAAKVDRMPLDDLSRDLQTSLRDLNRLLERLDREAVPEIAPTLQETRKTMAAARQLLEQDAPVQEDLRNALRETARAAESLRHLSDTLERHPEALLSGKPKDSQP